MWRLLREGIRFYRPVLLASWGFGVGIFFLVIAIIAVVGSVHDLNEMIRAGVQLPTAILISSMIAGFIALGTEKGENRVRLHVTLPIPIGQIALARILTPTALLLLGLAAAHVAFAVLFAVAGSPAVWLRHLTLDFIAVQLLFWLQVALALREIIELRHRARWPGALGSKAILIGVISLMVLIQLGPWESVTIRIAVSAALVALVMAFTVALFLRRTQFTS
jgi:hypothetical protein